MKITIPGSYISANEMFFKHSRPTAAYKRWFEYCLAHLPDLELDDSTEYELRIWLDTMRVSDADNCIKPLQDVLQKVCKARGDVFNDNQISAVSVDKAVVKRAEKALTFEIKPREIWKPRPKADLILPPFEKKVKK